MEPTHAAEEPDWIGDSVTNLNNLVNVLDFGMDLKKSIDTPNFRGPFFGSNIGGGPPSPQYYKEALAQGDFDEKIIETVIAKGQAIKFLWKAEAGDQSGYWTAILVDREASANRILLANSEVGLKDPGNVRQTSVCRWFPLLFYCRKHRQTEAQIRR
jgi:hypothetical protein